MTEHGLGYTPPRLSEAKRRAQMRETGFRDGRAGRAKRHDDREYLTSYRRGREQKQKEEDA